MKTKKVSKQPIASFMTNYLSNLLTLLLLVTSLNLKAQEVYSFEENLNWSIENVLVNAALDKFENIHTIENHGQFEKNLKLPNFGKKVSLPSYGSIKATITNVVYDKSLDFKGIDLNPEELELRSEVVNERGKFYGKVNFIPVGLVTGNYSAIKSFKLNIEFTPQTQSPTRHLNNTFTSVLSEGDIYKIAIPESGVYKITGNFLSGELGINLNDINPSTLKLYSNPGGRLPELIDENRPDDLQQIRIKVVGGEDGNFSGSDYILFYAEGADKYNFNQVDQSYEFDKNIYDDNNYVFIKTTGDIGVRVADFNNGSSAQQVFNTYDKLTRYEEDRINLLGANPSTQGSGKRWFGPSFETQNEQDFSDFFRIPGADLGQDSEISMAFAGRSASTSRISMTANSVLASINISDVRTEDPESLYARIRTLERTIPTTENYDIQVKYESLSGDRIEGWLDYIQLLTPVRTEYVDRAIFLQNKNTINLDQAGFSLTGLNSGLSIWNITDINNVGEIDFGGNPSFDLYFDTNNELKKFVVFDANAVESPIAIGKVINQNIHALDRADLILVYHPTLLSAAESLANHRREFDQINVQLVNIFDIYNEFAGGRTDPTALRDFSRMLYLRDSEFKYLLLFGDGSYDYRARLTNLPDQNFIPVYQTERHLEPIFAYPSDDYYALLDDGEGDRLGGALDIAVGRIPVNTLEAGQQVVDKIIHYQTSPETLGNWRVFAGFVADDEDGNLHLRQNEEISESLQNDIPNVNVNKVYYDSFVQESTPGGERYPAATEAIVRNIENGQLVTNYLGHGGAKGWSQERVFQQNDINNLKNFDHLTAMITATCSFTGYDDPAITTAGEQCITNPIGGAISLMTTVRSVFASANKELAIAVTDTLYTKDQGKYIPVGEVMRRAKNSDPSLDIDNIRKFAMIGDPSMRLNIPKYNVLTTEINGNTVSSSTTIDTISALQKVTIKGIIADDNGTIIEGFNGILTPIIYDKESTIRTLANDDSSVERDFKIQKNIIFKGKASVTAGNFEFSFVVPKDIDYTYGAGKISYYAHDGLRDDAWGNSDDIIIGGTFANAQVDDEGPQIELFMDNESFISGDQTSSNPTLLVNLSDDLGINITGTSIGHDITGVLDNDQSNTYILNDFYSSEVDDYTKGTISFPLEDIEPGLHTMKVKAFDIANNSAEGIIEFVVVENSDGKLTRVLNYPNPFTTNTSFWFEHDLNDLSISSMVNIYTISGKLVRQLQASSISRNGQVRDVQWNGTDEYGNRLAKGVYLYKIVASDSTGSNQRESETEKLVILK